MPTTHVIVYSYQNITLFPINRYNYSHNRKMFLKLEIMLRKATRTTKRTFLFHLSFVKLHLFIRRGIHATYVEVRTWLLGVCSLLYLVNPRDQG